MSSSAASEFPILCEICLGPNPLVRMTKEFGTKPCKICDRPFEVFRWQPGSAAGSAQPTRYKKTELCRTCAALKNVCQTCVLDLTYGVPVQVRDSLLAAAGSSAASVPHSSSGRTDLISRAEQKFLTADGIDFSALADQQNSKSAKASLMLQKLARRTQTPFYDRNLAHRCSYFAAGRCNRGAQCPYRHEIRNENDQTAAAIAKQNIKDRYDGTNDPVAMKILSRHQSRGSKPFTEPIHEPADAGVRTLWVGALPLGSTEDMIRASFNEFADKIVRINPIDSKDCAFIQFSDSDAARSAARIMHGKLKINEKFVKLDWAKENNKEKSGNPNKSSEQFRTAKVESAASESVNLPNNHNSSSFNSSEVRRSVAPPPGVKLKSSASQSLQLPSLPPLPNLEFPTDSTSQPIYSSQMPLANIVDQQK